MISRERPPRGGHTLRERCLTRWILGARDESARRSGLEARTPSSERCALTSKQGHVTATPRDAVRPAGRLKVREGLKKSGHSELYKGKAAVMEQVEKWMANGVSVIKDAKDLAPGKSMTILLHGEPLEPPPPIECPAADGVDGPPPRDLKHRAEKELNDPGCG